MSGAHYNAYLNKHWSFLSKSVIAREDRSLLNKVSQLAIDVSVQAMEAAQKDKEYSERDREGFPIFSATETIEYNLTALDELLASCSFDVGVALNQLGGLKPYFNPLDMLRLLSTNSIYHLSKVFGLHGGGYPLQKMSLGSLCALESACSAIKSGGQTKALVVGVGNLCMAENLTAFIKMDAVKKPGISSGIIPAYGAASLIIESQSDNAISNRTQLAKIIKVASVYHNKSFVTQENWHSLFAQIDVANIDDKKLNVVYYNNGITSLFEEEKKAVTQCFPKANCFSYKPYVGYAGKANNLIDLVIALSDKRIPKGSYILVNGIGNSTGLGCILVKKLCGV